MYLLSSICVNFFSLFFFNDTATTEIYTLSLHDALPISSRAAFISRNTPSPSSRPCFSRWDFAASKRGPDSTGDRKSTRLNSSHSQISYAVFCLKKKKKLDKHLNLKTLGLRIAGLPDALS